MSGEKTYEELIDSINSAVFTNGVKSVTAAIVNLLLKEILLSTPLKHIVADSVARNAIVTKYAGMLVFVTGEDKLYTLADDLTTWRAVTINGYTITQTDVLLNNKVDKVGGKGLSTNDFTNALKNKLDGIAAGATVNSSDSHLLNRTNHTGTQAISTITDLESTLTGIINDIIVLENGVNVSYKNITLTTSSLYQIEDREHTILINSEDEDKSIILPDAGINQGRILCIKKVDDAYNKITILPFDYNESGSTSNDFQLIEGGVNFTIYNHKDSVVLQARSGRWFIINNPDIHKGVKQLLEFTTQNAANQTVLEIPIPESSAGYWEGRVTAIKESTGKVLISTIIVGYRRKHPAFQLTTPTKVDTGTLGTTFTLSTSGGNLLLKAKGISGTDIKWVVNFSLMVNKI